MDRFEHLQPPGLEKLTRNIALIWNPRRMAIQSRLEETRKPWTKALAG